jgi:choline kinase
MTDYFESLENIIQNILSKPNKTNFTYDILDTEKTKTNKLIILREKQRQMKIGEIWQEVLGNYTGFINLKSGHISGLDIFSSRAKRDGVVYPISYKKTCDRTKKSYKYR